MFPFFLKKTRFIAIFTGLVLLFMAGSLFISCSDADNTDPVNAQQPSISVQPIGGNWNVTTDETFHLAVTASVDDGGTLSYQWYSNTANSASGGTPIGTNSKDHRLNKEDYDEGDDLYFYVVVTNTNNSVDGNKTAATTSDVVKIEVRTTGETGGNPEEGEEWEWDLPAELSGYFQTPISYSDWGEWGGWSWTDDGFAVDPVAKTFWYYHDSTMENGWGGTIVHHTPESTTTSDPGILIVKVTQIKGTSWVSSELEGRYFAVAYKNLAVSGDYVAVSSATAYSYGDDAKNDGVDTLAEAISEYTATSDYFSVYGNYILHPVTAVTLGDLKGTWTMEDDEDYYIIIRGTTFTELYDDYEDPNGIYDGPDSDDMLGEMGDIVDHTDITQTSGVLYIKLIDGGYVFSNGKFIAVAWQNKDGDSIEFATGNNEKDTLEAIKAEYPDTSSFIGGWNNYER